MRLTPDTPKKPRCGRCTRCLDACPTEAFSRPFVLDPRRCVSYLTVEMPGEIPEQLRRGVGEHLFGCDDCQNVCPYNRAVPPTPRPQYATLPRWREVSLEDLVDLGEQDWTKLAKGSPVRRATRHAIARNAIAVLASRRLPRYRALLERAARSHPDEAVRRHAAWGLSMLDGVKGAAK